jgi:hypothetical protein
VTNNETPTIQAVEGSFLRQRNHCAYAARVTVVVQPCSCSRVMDITATCSGKVLSLLQGDIEEATPEGYSDWKQGAEAGARFALRIAKSGNWSVCITRIVGMTTDTNPTIVGAATMQAVWKAIGFVPDLDTATRVEAMALESWQHPHDFIPDFA